MDVKSTFMNDYIEKEMYIDQPLGFLKLLFSNIVFKTEKRFSTI